MKESHEITQQPITPADIVAHVNRVHEALRSDALAEMVLIAGKKLNGDVLAFPMALQQVVDLTNSAQGILDAAANGELFNHDSEEAKDKCVALFDGLQIAIENVSGDVSLGEWKKDRPTRPGWYLANKTHDFFGPLLAYVSEREGRLWIQYQDSYYSICEPLHAASDKFSFAGPIVLPLMQAPNSEIQESQQ